MDAHQCVRSSFVSRFHHRSNLVTKDERIDKSREKDASADLESLVILIHSLHVGF